METHQDMRSGCTVWEWIANKADGRVTVVAGGTKGLGKAIALVIVEAGADIVVVSRSPHPDMEGVVSALRRRHFRYPAGLMDPKGSQSIISRVPADRWGAPEEIAEAAVFLASPTSDFIHGAILPIDGVGVAWRRKRIDDLVKEVSMMCLPGQKTGIRLQLSTRLLPYLRMLPS